jgi:uncharacterized surface protein with fasciclin (FAS1) repeats
MIRVFSILILMALFVSCIDSDNPDVFKTFEDETVTSFLEKNPDTYSEFFRFLKEADLNDLLSAYGTYTCFAPTNDAFQKYYAEKETSFDAMSEEDKIELAYNHILNKIYNSQDFPSGPIPDATLGERFLSFSFAPGAEGMTVVVNDKSRITAIDQKMHNGVIHTIDAVLQPSKTALPEVIDGDDDKRYSLFAEALYLTGLHDSLRLVQDYSYVQVPQYYSTYYNEVWATPAFKKYGYTAFVESDSLYRAKGISSIEDMKRYAAKIYDVMYPADVAISDPTNRRNSLNRFIAYHLVARAQSENEFFASTIVRYFIPGTVLYEYIETMNNTLIEGCNQGGAGLVFNKRANGSAIRIISPNHEAVNGVFHEIDDILVYDSGMETDVLNKRLRMDAATMLPELNTNKMRFAVEALLLLPKGYLSNIDYADNSEIFYKVYAGYANTGGDEVLLGGKYDFTLRIPPVPPGTYEIRIRYHASDPVQRGVAQVYFDGVPCGIPLDMRITASNPKIGYIADSETDDNGVENDKMMRNRGYMKDINTSYLYNFTAIARGDSPAMRRILTTKTFHTTAPHFLRIKCVEERSANFQVDYLEFVPTHVIATEGRD